MQHMIVSPTRAEASAALLNACMQAKQGCESTTLDSLFACAVTYVRVCIAPKPTHTPPVAEEPRNEDEHETLLRLMRSEVEATPTTHEVTEYDPQLTRTLLLTIITHGVTFALQTMHTYTLEERETFEPILSPYAATLIMPRTVSQYTLLLSAYAMSVVTRPTTLSREEHVARIQGWLTACVNNSMLPVSSKPDTLVTLLLEAACVMADQYETIDFDSGDVADVLSSLELVVAHQFDASTNLPAIREYLMTLVVHVRAFWCNARLMHEAFDSVLNNTAPLQTYMQDAHCMWTRLLQQNYLSQTNLNVLLTHIYSLCAPLGAVSMVRMGRRSSPYPGQDVAWATSSNARRMRCYRRVVPPATTLRDVASHYQPCAPWMVFVALIALEEHLSPANVKLLPHAKICQLPPTPIEVVSSSGQLSVFFCANHVIVYNGFVTLCMRGDPVVICACFLQTVISTNYMWNGKNCYDLLKKLLP